MRISFVILILALCAHAQTARVSHVSDGDSFILASGERVRMIGINAPELADKFGSESKEHLARLIRGKTVTLEGDAQNDDRDVHGRMLRYVTVDGMDVNRQMIADGYAYAFLRYRFSQAKRDSYRSAESAAKASRVGIWMSEPTGAQPETQPTSAIPTSDPPTRGLSFSNGKWIAAGVIFMVVVVLFALRYAGRH